MACIYDVTGKCKDMPNPERFNNLNEAFYDTKLAGIHDTIIPSPESSAYKI